MDHLYALRDVGVADPAPDLAAEAAGRAALASEIARATATPRPGARRRTRPRARTRTRLTIPAVGLAAAGVAAVVVIAAGNGGSPASAIDARNTAYIIQRVRAHLSTTGQGEVDSWVQSGGNGNPGTNVTATGRWYTDPQSGVQYSSDTVAQPDGTVIYEQYTVGTPVGKRVQYTYTALDPVQHLYAISSDIGPNDGPTPDPAADAQQIRAELDSGTVTQDGTATIDGQPTIKLTFSASPSTGGSSGTLYVNAQTYEPVQSTGVDIVDPKDPADGTDTDSEIWQPATQANIAQVKLAQIPAGYTQVSVAQLHAANRASR